MSEYTILQGDAYEVLKTLPSESVDMCVTSPPYYALRDYGTETWEGGDPNCDHVANPNATKVQGNKEFNDNRHSRGETKVKGYYEDICPKCGAKRVDRQIGMEDTVDAYIQRLVDVFHEVKRVLKNDGTLWLNIGDSYAGSGKGGANYPESVKGTKQSTNKGSVIAPLPIKIPNGLKPKDLIGVPWMLAFALRADGWYLRQDIIWCKPNPMPESVKDRCTKCHEYIFLLSKSPRYYFDNEAIQENANPKHQKRYDSDFHAGKKETDTKHCPNGAGNTAGRRAYTGKRNKRDVWNINVASFRGAHFATFPEKLVEPCVLAGSRVGGVVLDCFNGAGTTGVASVKNDRNYIGIELNQEYVKLSNVRIKDAIKTDGVLQGQIGFFDERTDEDVKR